jgi:hypothetical protein
LPARVLKRFQRVSVEGRGTFLVDVDVRKLHAAAARVLGPDVRLAGKRVAPA